MQVCTLVLYLFDYFYRKILRYTVHTEFLTLVVVYIPNHNLDVALISEHKLLHVKHILAGTRMMKQVWEQPSESRRGCTCVKPIVDKNYQFI